MRSIITGGGGVLVLGMYLGGAMAGMGADGGFDADRMVMHLPIPHFLRARATTNSLFAFSGALGGIECEPVTATGDSSRPFSCNGNTFTTFTDAAKRSCDDQNTACSDLANDEKKNTAGLTVNQCSAQRSTCVSAASAGPQSAAAQTKTSSTTTSTTSTTPPPAAVTTTTTPAAAAPVQVSTTPQAVQPQTTTTQQAAAPVVVVSSTPQAAAPVQVTTSAVVVQQPSSVVVVVPSQSVGGDRGSGAGVNGGAAGSVLASIPSPSATLHSSDEDFFYFCDP